MKLMFICTGNICRSAMAHVMLESRVKKQKKNIEVYSCGLFAQDGDSPTEEAIFTLNTIYDVDLRNHRATNIADAPIEQMDIILCATVSHKNNVLNKYPKLDGKVYTMKEFVGYSENDWDIKDPWGCNFEVYKKCAGEINECIDKLIEKV